MKKSKIEKKESQIENEYLSRIQSAKFLGISISKFDQLKDLSCIRIGKRKIFSIFKLREYANNHAEKELKNE